MAGAEAGFDVSTPEGAMAWMREMIDKPLPPSISLPPLGPPVAVEPARSKLSAGAQRAKKDKRKAERKARRKNR
jgi:hypothetical protein